MAWTTYEIKKKSIVERHCALVPPGLLHQRTGQLPLPFPCDSGEYRV